MGHESRLRVLGYVADGVRRFDILGEIEIMETVLTGGFGHGHVEIEWQGANDGLPASGYAMVGVMVAKFGKDVRVAVTGAGPSAFRLADMEAALTKNFAPDSVANIAMPADGLNSDMHASAEYRAHLVGVMAARAVTAAR